MRLGERVLTDCQRGDEGLIAVVDDWDNCSSRLSSPDLAGETESRLKGPVGGDCEPSWKTLKQSSFSAGLEQETTYLEALSRRRRVYVLQARAFGPLFLPQWH